ncbi:MAG: 1,4-dihydroxy-2-naphthoate polyprenyltransferase [Anaerolineae bacterium]|nr:MAG: 1,4-dihydroxy-2-naphthoate polyprenyltransferase [Anaerolineae bacterium]
MQPNPWIIAARPKTLPAAAAPVIVGGAVAAAQGGFHFLPWLAALLGALLLQIGANFANDAFDYQKGADTEERLGPTRVTQSGLLTPRQVFTGMWVVFGLAALCGLYLIFVGGWPVLAIGVASILSAIAYTGGPYPLGYHGLGDLFVFLFFGLAAVCGTVYVQLHAVPALAWWAALPMGFIITAILVVNNLRDIETDRKAGKHTLAVRLGAGGAKAEYALLLAGSYAVPLVVWLLGLASPWGLLAWLSLPKAWGLWKTVSTQTGRVLNQALAGTGQLALLFAILFAVGMLL